MNKILKIALKIVLTAIVIIAIIVGCLFLFFFVTEKYEEKKVDEIYWIEVERMNEAIKRQNSMSGNQNQQDDYEKAIFTLDDYPKVDASLAIHPLCDAIAADFLDMEPIELDFTYTKTRSSDVYHNLIDGNCDVILAAEISDEDIDYAKEKGVELEIIPFTSSAFVFIVNTSNPVDGLSLEEVQKIYSGEITNWKEVGGDDNEILAYQRPTGSGSQTAMLSLVMKDVELMTPLTNCVEIEMGELIDAIAEYDNSKQAIGYSYFYYVNTMYKKDTIKMLAIDGITPSIETIKDGSYPLYTNGYIVYNKNETNNPDSNVTKWVDAVLSDRGSQIITDNGYVPLN